MSDKSEALDLKFQNLKMMHLGQYIQSQIC